MKLEKDDVIIFIGDHGYSDAYELKASFLKLPEEKQKKMLEDVARDWCLPLSLGKVVSIFKAQRISAVADEEKVKQEIKGIRKDRAKRRYEKELERIEKDS